MSAQPERGPKSIKGFPEIIRKRFHNTAHLYNVNKDVRSFIFIGCVNFERYRPHSNKQAKSMSSNHVWKNAVGK